MPPQLMDNDAMNVHNPNPMDVRDSPAYTFIMFQQEREQREQRHAEELDRYHSTIGSAIAAERAAGFDDGVQPADLPRYVRRPFGVPIGPAAAMQMMRDDDIENVADLEPAQRRPRILRVASTRNPRAADPRAGNPGNNEETSDSEEQGPAGNAASGSQRG